MALVVLKASFNNQMTPIQIVVPKDAFKILHVGQQSSDVVVWYETLDPIADHSVPAYKYEMRIVATGEEVPVGFQYVGTSVTSASEFVWHVYGRFIDERPVAVSAINRD